MSPRAPLTPETTPSEASGQRPCPLCEGWQRQLLFRHQQWDVVRCLDCTMVFLAQKFSYGAQVQDYDWAESYRRERERRKREHPLLLFFSDLTRRLKPEMADRLLAQTLRWKKGGKLADFGCGDGAFLEKASRHFDVTGVEISPNAAQRARERLPNANILLGPVTEVPLPEETFDVVTQFSFLEHEWNPGAALRAACRALKPGGITVIKVPNHASWNRRVLGQAWSGYRLPDHCNYFTPKTCRQMLTQAGLRPLGGSFLDQLSTSDSLWMAAGKPF